ncbi:MAG: Ig-like domain-containing protein [Gemmatimonadales bacterium]
MIRTTYAVLAPVAILLLGACKKAEPGGCDPTDPLCGGGSAIDTIVVSSAIDSVIDVGATSQMTAQARTSSGTPVSATMAWTSLTPATATVDPASGLVTAVAVGTTTIRASQSSNSVVGRLPLRVVDADLPRASALVTDSIAARMRQALSTAPRGAMTTILTNCGAQLTAGNLVALNTCLTNAAAVSGGTNGNDNALLNVLDLFYLHARRQLQL